MKIVSVIITELHLRGVHKVTIISAIGVNVALFGYLVMDIKSIHDLLESAATAVAILEHLIPDSGAIEAAVQPLVEAAEDVAENV